MAKKTDDADQLATQLLHNRIDQLQTQVEALVEEASEAKSLRAENAALKENIKGREIRLTRKQTMEKVERIREASRMKPISGKFHWEFQLIVKGHFNRDNSPKLMPQVFRWPSKFDSKVKAIHEMNQALHYDWRPEDVVARGVDFEPLELRKKEGEEVAKKPELSAAV